MNDRRTSEFRAFWCHDQQGADRSLAISVDGIILTAWKSGEDSGSGVFLDRERLRQWWEPWETVRLREPVFPFQPLDIRSLSNNQAFDLSQFPFSMFRPLVDRIAEDQPSNESRQLERDLHVWLSHRCLSFADTGTVLPPILFYATQTGAFVELLGSRSNKDFWAAQPSRWSVDPDQVQNQFAELLETTSRTDESVRPDWYSEEFCTSIESLVGVAGGDARTFWRKAVGEVGKGDLKAIAQAISASKPMRVGKPLQDLRTKIGKLESANLRPWALGSKASKVLLEVLGKERIDDPKSIAEELGVQVTLVDMPSNDVKGSCFQRGENAPVIVVNKSHPNHRKAANLTFTIAHELYHAIVDCIGAQPVELVVSLEKDSKSREKAANAFAAYGIVPKPVFKKAMKKFEKSESLAKRLGWAARDLNVGVTLIVLNAGHYDYASEAELHAAAKELHVEDLALSFHLHE